MILAVVTLSVSKSFVNKKEKVIKPHSWLDIFANLKGSPID
jgi:hypothetical protein